MEALCVTRPWIVDHEASCPASRLTTHDSGSVWLAKPSPYGSFIRSSTPVYPGALIHFCTPKSIPEDTLPFRHPKPWMILSLLVGLKFQAGVTATQAPANWRSLTRALRGIW